MAKFYERAAPPPPPPRREEEVRIEEHPPLPRGYAPKSVAVTVKAGQVILANLCLSMVVSPPAPSPPKPKPKPGTADISGFIKDAEKGFFLGDVLLSINGQQEKSQASGFYHLDDIPPGAYRLTAEKERYKEYVWTIKLKERDDVKKDISLVPLPKVKDMNVMNRVTGWVEMIAREDYDPNKHIEAPEGFRYPTGGWQFVKGYDNITYYYVPNKWAIVTFPDTPSLLKYAQQLADTFGGIKELFYRIRA